MPVESNTVEYTYTGDGASMVFPFPSLFLSNTDILVGVDGVLQASGYTVSGAGNPSGGNVTFATAPAAAASIVLLRKPPINQLVDFVSAQTVLEGVLDRGLDKLTMIAQYLTRSQARSVQVGELSGLTGPVLPNADTGKALVWTAAGGLENSEDSIADMKSAIDALELTQAIALGDLSALVKRDGSQSMTGELTLSGNATASLSAVPKQQVLLLDGTQSMTALFSLSGDAVTPLQAVTKQQFDRSTLRSYVNRSLTMDGPSEFPDPLTKFFEEIPIGATMLAQTAEYLFDPNDAAHFITWLRDPYGQVPFRQTFNSYIYTSNGGIAGSGTEDTPGGSGMSAATRTAVGDDQGLTTTDDRTNNEGGGYRNGATPITAPVPPHAAWRPATGQVATVGYLSNWMAKRYHGGSGGVAAGAVNDSISNTLLARLTTIGNVGTPAVPNLRARITSFDVSFANTVEEELDVAVVATSYLLRNDLPKWYTFDPRTSALAAHYPFSSDGITINAISTLNRTLATGFANGQVISEPGYPSHTLVTGEKILAAGQTAAGERKVYTVQAAGAPVALVTQPTQVTATGWGTWSVVSAAPAWARTFNYTGLPVIAASTDGTKAQGIYCPSVPYDGEGGNTVLATGNMQYNVYDKGAVNGQSAWEVAARKAVAGIAFKLGARPYSYRYHQCVGSLAQVQADFLFLDAVYKFFRPTVWDWEFVRDSQPTILTGLPEGQVRDWYLRVGVNTGIIPKAGFSFSGKPALTRYRDYIRSLA